MGRLNYTTGAPMAHKQAREGATFADLNTLEVNADQLADLFGVKKGTVLHYAREAGMPRVGRGRYRLADCVQWYLEKQRDLLTNDGGDMSEERRKLIAAQRHRHELEAARLRSELIDADAVTAVFNELGVIYATQLDGLGPRVAPRLLNQQNTGEVVRIIHDESRHIRRSTSAAIQNFASAYTSIENSRTPPAT